MLNSYRFIFLLIIAFILINFNALNSYFSQDDFFHLRQVLGKSIHEIPNFFLPWNDLGYAFYRPLSREVFGFLSYNLFGLNPLIFHLLNALVIFLIGVNLFKFVGLLTKNRYAQNLSIMFYTLSNVHNIELFYLSSIQTLLAALFVLLSINNFYFYIEKKRKVNFWYSILFFILGILSHESAIVIIPLIGLIRIFKRPVFNLHLFKKTFFDLIPFLTLFFLRLIIYFFSVQLPKEEVYNPSFSPRSILNTLIWYILWTFGLSEILVDFMTLTLNFNPDFFRFHSNYAIVVFPSTMLIVFILSFFVFIARKAIVRNSGFIYILAAYSISLLPFVFFPKHKFVYYLSLPTVFLSALLATLTILIPNKFLSKAGLLILLVCLTLISVNTSLLNEKTYWAAKRAKAAKTIITDTLMKYPKPAKGAVFLVNNNSNYPNISKEWGSSSKQAFYILSGSDAFQLFYRDPTIKVIYEDMSSKEDILGLNSDKVYIINPYFPF